MTAEQLKSLAKSAGVTLRQVATGRWSCDQVDGGRPMAAIEMAGELRLMIGGAVGILARGWVDFKDAAKAHAIPWQNCVELRRPDQLRGVSQLIVSKSAHMRHDWRAWAKPVRERLGGKFVAIRTAAPDLTISKLAEVCGLAKESTRQMVHDLGLPYKVWTYNGRVIE